MRALPGLLTGALGLLILHAFVARANTNQVTGLIATAAGLADRFLDPSIPAIPERGDTPAPAAVTHLGNVADNAGKTVLSQIPAPTGR